MWIFTKEGYFSAVQNDKDPGQIMVRSRKREDLEAFLAVDELELEDTEILEWAGSDYRYRVFIPRGKWMYYLCHCVEELDYTNFKAAAIPLDDTGRSACYHNIWGSLKNWQDADLDLPEEPLYYSGIFPEYEEDDPDAWLRNYWIKGK
jgi:hypothetical protein